MSIKFCDWLREREITEESKGAPNVSDKQAWMIASIDVDGKVVISTITNVAFGLLSASKFVIVDPQKDALKLPDSTLSKY